MLLPAVMPSETHELLVVTSGWKTSTGSNTSALGAVDYQGPHFSTYLSFASNTLTIVKDCELDLFISVSIASNTRRANTFVLQLTRSGTTTTLATATDNSNPVVYLGRMKFYAGDTLKGTQNNANGTATIRTLEAWIINP